MARDRWRSAGRLEVRLFEAATGSDSAPPLPMLCSMWLWIRRPTMLAGGADGQVA